MARRLQESITEYLASRKAHGYATNTIKNDRKTLDALLVTAGNIPTGKLDANHIDAFMAVKATTCGPGSLNAHQACLSAFIKWCQQRGHLPLASDPLAGRRYRKVTPRDRIRVPADRFHLLLDAAGKVHTRDRCLVAVGLFLMLRGSEATELRIRDVNLSDSLMTVNIRKTKLIDNMPISAELDRELRTWLTAYTQTVGPLDSEWYLFPSRNKTGMVRGDNGRFVQAALTTDSIRPLRRMQRPQDVVKRALEAAGYTVPSHEGMHTLRRSGARALFDELAAAGYDGALRTVQAMLHHSSSTMTEKYLGIDLDKQTRDTKFAGKVMFPSLQADNVLSFPVTASEG